MLRDAEALIRSLAFGQRHAQGRMNSLVAAKPLVAHA
jgi:hypothetical protein